MIIKIGFPLRSFASSGFISVFSPYFSVPASAAVSPRVPLSSSSGNYVNLIFRSYCALKCSSNISLMDLVCLRLFLLCFYFYYCYYCAFLYKMPKQIGNWTFNFG